MFSPQDVPVSAQHTPKVSVIMTVYNEAKFLPAALDSLLAQSFTDFEICIVDDGSTDETSEILKRYHQKDVRVRLVGKGTAIGRVAALNLAVKASKGRWLAVMDSDDLSQPKRLARQVTWLETHPNLGFLASGFEQINAEGVVIKPAKENTLTSFELTTMLATQNPVCHGSMMFSREIFDAVGGYREAFDAAIDYDLILRLAYRYEIAILPDVLYQHRVHGNAKYGAYRRLRQLQMKAMAQSLYAQRCDTGSDALGEGGITSVPEQQLYVESFLARDLKANGEAYAQTLFELGKKFRAEGERKTARRLFFQALRLNALKFRYWRYFLRG